MGVPGLVNDTWNSSRPNMPMLRQLKLMPCSGRTLQQKGAVAIAVPWPRNLCNDESECQSHFWLVQSAGHSAVPKEIEPKGCER